MGLYKHDDYGYDKDDDYSGLMSGLDEFEQPSFARKENPSIVEPEDNYSQGMLKHTDDFVYPYLGSYESTSEKHDEISDRLDKVNKKIDNKNVKELINKLALTSSQEEIKKLLIDNFEAIQSLCNDSNKKSNNGNSRTRKSKE